MGAGRASHSTTRAFGWGGRGRCPDLGSNSQLRVDVTSDPNHFLKLQAPPLNFLHSRPTWVSKHISNLVKAGCFVPTPSLAKRKTIAIILDLPVISSALPLGHAQEHLLSSLLPLSCHLLPGRQTATSAGTHPPSSWFLNQPRWLLPQGFVLAATCIWNALASENPHGGPII